MRRLYPSWIAKSSLRSRIVLLASSSMLAQLITILSLPIIARLFSPAELGLASLVMVFMIATMPIICLRYEAAVPLARSGEAARLIVLCILAALLAGSGFYAAFRLMQHNLFLGYGNLPSWTHWFVLASMPGSAFFAVGQAWWLRQQRAGYIGAYLIARSASHNGIGVAAGLAGAGVVGLMLAEAARALSAVYLVPGMPWRRILRPASRPARLRATASQWRRFPLIEGPSTALNVINTFLPVPLVATLYGPGAAGLFAIALRIGSIPIGQVGTAISNATYMEFSSAARRGDHPAIVRLFSRMARLLMLFGIPTMAALGLGGFLLAGPILGEVWADSGIFLALMTPWLYARFVVVPGSRILSVLQKQARKLAVDLFFLANLIGSYLLAMWLGLGVFSYVTLLSGLMTFSYGVYFVVLWSAVRSSPK